MQSDHLRMWAIGTRLRTDIFEVGIRVFVLGVGLGVTAATGRGALGFP